MEIERKYLLKRLPGELSSYRHHEIEQVYLNTDPVIRARKSDDRYYLTYKGSGLMAREEYNLPLNETSYYHLREKADCHPVTKTRYLIPLDQGLTGELDVFHGLLEGLVFMEIEFESIEQANSYTPPEWVKEDVTNDFHYHNSYLSTIDAFPTA